MSHPRLQDELLCTCSCLIAGALATVPRLYHGVATLIASGAIWTGGTNPQVWTFACCRISSWGQADIRVASCITLLHETVNNCKQLNYSSAMQGGYQFQSDPANSV